MSGNHWTGDENDKLRYWWPKEGAACAARFPGRTAVACTSQAARLHLRGKRVHPEWTDAEKGIIEAFYPALGARGLFESGQLPGRSKGSIRKQAAELHVAYEGAPAAPGSWEGEVEPYVPRAPWTPACERLARATWARTLGKADGCRELAATRAANLLCVPYEAFAARLAELDGRWAT